MTKKTFDPSEPIPIDPVTNRPIRGKGSRGSRAARPKEQGGARLPRVAPLASAQLLRGGGGGAARGTRGSRGRGRGRGAVLLEPHQPHAALPAQNTPQHLIDQSASASLLPALTLREMVFEQAKVSQEGAYVHVNNNHKTKYKTEADEAAEIQSNLLNQQNQDESDLDSDLEDDEDEEDKDIVIEPKTDQEKADMKALLDSFDEDQLHRFEVFRRSRLSKGAVKKIITTLLGTTTVPNNILIAIGGTGKLFIGDIVEIGREVMVEYGDEGALSPEHVREAYRRWKLANRWL
ncbi:transcription initiation factor TFIID subunit 11 [Podochytrium sp. JEL0797]|nr:transcription initiation factor TFIID subunit 11 [Podochytrium sp. JEL0797]